MSVISAEPVCPLYCVLLCVCMFRLRVCIHTGRGFIAVEAGVFAQMAAGISDTVVLVGGSGKWKRSEMSAGTLQKVSARTLTAVIGERFVLRCTGMA